MLRRRWFNWIVARTIRFQPNEAWNSPLASHWCIWIRISKRARNPSGLDFKYWRAAKQPWRYKFPPFSGPWGHSLARTSINRQRCRGAHEIRAHRSLENLIYWQRTWTRSERINQTNVGPWALFRRSWGFQWGARPGGTNKKGPRILIQSSASWRRPQHDNRVILIFNYY